MKKERRKEANYNVTQQSRNFDTLTHYTQKNHVRNIKIHQKLTK